MAAFRLAWENSQVRELAPEERCPSGPGRFTWEHFAIGEGADELLERNGDIPDVVLSALVASETRPRCEQFGDGALVNLRGPAVEPDETGDRLVSIRAWAQGNRVLTVSRRKPAALDDVVEQMRGGTIADPGDLVAALSQAISNELDPDVVELGDAVDACESRVESGNIYALRRRIAALRTEAISYRRFVSPDRDALLALSALQVDWLAEEDRLHIREAADRFARMAEELEAVRERAALLHEQLTDMRAELIDQRSLMIAVVAFIFLPLTFITGLLGMNVEGIPFAHAHWAFWGVTAFCVVVGIIVFAWFAARHWLAR